MKAIFYALLAVTVLSSSSAMAACPPETGGGTAEEIRASQERIVCLQNELSAETRLKKLELDVKALERQTQSLELEQRFDALPKSVPSVSDPGF